MTDHDGACRYWGRDRLGLCEGSHCARCSTPLSAAGATCPRCRARATEGARARNALGLLTAILFTLVPVLTMIVLFIGGLLVLLIGWGP
jgi:predicted nucleic acid-binding Zn ribbon protein